MTYSACHYRDHAEWLVVMAAVVQGVKQGMGMFPGVGEGGIACSDTKYCRCSRVVRVVWELQHYYGGPELGEEFGCGLGMASGCE